MSYGVSNQRIADQIGISRQAVARHRRRGMPCDSLEAACNWYQHNVDGRRRRGMFSRLPHRPRPIVFDDESDRIIRELEARDEEPEPLKLDNFPADFWGADATKSILAILGNGSTKAFRKRENVLAAWLCVNAATRLHLCLMPEKIAASFPERDRERITEALAAWTDLFCRHWWGDDYQSQPILSESAKSLDAFYQPLTHPPG